MKKRTSMAIILAALGMLAWALVPGVWAATANPSSPSGHAKGKKSTLRILSKSFEGGKWIPDKYSCKGANISPEIHWTGVPTATKSFALIVDDPDAPMQTWVHWVIFNIPNRKPDINGSTYELVENFPREEEIKGGILQGLNDFKKIGYDGPCPPNGVHRYYFKLYALDCLLPLKAGAMKSQVEQAMKGHILDQWQLMGLYGK